MKREKHMGLFPQPLFTIEQTIERIDRRRITEFGAMMEQGMACGMNENEAKAHARATLIRKYGPSVFVREHIGVASGGRFYERWLGSLRIHLSNLRAKLAERRAR